VSFGSLPAAEISCELIEKEFHFTWDPTVPAGELPSDQVMLLVYYPERKSSGRNWNTTGQLRNTGKNAFTRTR
jgi:hypothetical protein